MAPGTFWREGIPDELDVGKVVGEMGSEGRGETFGPSKCKDGVSVIGMEEAGGEAVLGRRWEFGIGLARCVSFHLMQTARAPEVVGRLLQGPLKHYRWCPLQRTVRGTAGHVLKKFKGVLCSPASSLPAPQMALEVARVFLDQVPFEVKSLCSRLSSEQFDD